MSHLERAVAALLDSLDRISVDHEELTDTDVRESMHLALNWYFVWGNDRSRFPRTFGMFSAEGDLLVANAIRQFLRIPWAPGYSAAGGAAAGTHVRRRQLWRYGVTRVEAV